MPDITEIIALMMGAALILGAGLGWLTIVVLFANEWLRYRLVRVRPAQRANARPDRSPA